MLEIKNTRKNDLDFTDEKLTEMFTWPHFHGFTAAKCSKCKSTANVKIFHGWICMCGHYNALLLDYHQIPYDNPDYGPTKKRIQEAIDKSRENK